MKIRKCLRCKRVISGHRNRKRCEPCAAKIRKQPLGKLSQAQIKIVKNFADKIYKKDVAKKANTSWANLGRWAKQNGVSLNAHKYKENLINDVCKYYSKYSNKKTAEYFNLKSKQVEAIVYRYRRHSPRQIKWKNNEIIELAKMAGLVSQTAQAKYFNRPHANAGSIKSAWIKKFGFGPSNINGMVHDSAKHFVNIKARYIRPIGQGRDGTPSESRRLILWVDMAKCLKKDCPDHIHDAVNSLAKFQSWLHGTKRTKQAILKMIKEREIG